MPELRPLQLARIVFLTSYHASWYLKEIEFSDRYRAKLILICIFKVFPVIESTFGGLL
jgi:hypothetical protein